MPKGPVPYVWCDICGRDLSEPVTESQTRSGQQNKAIHVYCELLAIAFNDAGLDMKEVLKPEIDIPWEMKTVKEFIWKPIQKAQLQKQSTTQLDTAEVSKVYETINRHISEKFGVTVEFPSNDLLE